ncbi:hypothetical protein A2U01_0086022, partial [Trifolium medium]|nr:hypothetical protein [Trifolium medium]
SPIPAPKCLQRSFCLHPRPHEEKISVFGSQNGAIPTGIRSDGCKLTSLPSPEPCSDTWVVEGKPHWVGSTHWVLSNHISDF